MQRSVDPYIGSLIEQRKQRRAGARPPLGRGFLAQVVYHLLKAAQLSREGNKRSTQGLAELMRLRRGVTASGMPFRARFATGC